MNKGRELYQAGKLAEAIEAMNAEVKAKPTDVAARGFLAELLCFAGNHQRADLLLDQMSGIDPSLAVPLSLLRQLVRADMSREQFRDEGRLPEFVDQPGDRERAYLQASILMREGKFADAAAVLAPAEEGRKPVSGSHDGTPFSDFRDLDDLAPSMLEVYTSTGKYFWIPIERVIEIEFHPPERPHHLIWRQATMAVAEGPEGEVYLPVLYSGSSRAGSDALRLGRETDWQGKDGEPVRGVGQRCFLVGEDIVPIMELNHLVFDRSA
jgi:type VI secretion system protein ImpE